MADYEESSPPSRDGREKRRSRRVLLVIPVTVTWTSTDGEHIQEQAHTEVVNAHGCLLRMTTDNFIPLALEVNNPQTREAVKARVICFRGAREGAVRFAVELRSPNPALWGISIPPAEPSLN